MPDTTVPRPVRELVHLLQYRATFGRPCYIKRNTRHAALIVPHLRDGAHGPYSYLRTFNRTTVDQALQHGLIELGSDLVPVPQHAGPRGHWSTEPAHKGRAIRLTQTGGDAR